MQGAEELPLHLELLELLGLQEQVDLRVSCWRQVAAGQGGQHWVHCKVRSGGGVITGYRCNCLTIYDLGFYNTTPTSAGLRAH